MRAERRDPALWPTDAVNPRGEELRPKANPVKSYDIPKRLVVEAYRRVKRNRGAAGVDGESLAMFEKGLANNLYKIWNRMSSGSYVPPHCRTEQEAEGVLVAIRERFAECGLMLHPTKTRIVYCKDSKRRGRAAHVQFDCLSHTFRARPVRSRFREHELFFGFMPAISAAAAKRIRERIRG